MGRRRRRSRRRFDVTIPIALWVGYMAYEKEIETGSDR